MTDITIGLIVRFWQLGIEMRPFFVRNSLWIYPLYGGIGASFGYWLQGVEDKQMRYLQDAKNRLLEKRKRRAERENGLKGGDAEQKADQGLIPSPAT